MSATSLPQPDSSSRYRVAEYHDGKFVRIHESRRRSNVTGLADSQIPATLSTSSTSTRHARSLELCGNLLPTQRSSSNDQGTRSDNGSKNRELRLSTHVTPLAYVSPRAKAVIFQSPMPLRSLKKELDTLSETSGIPTPPPTPRIGRSSTPELEDMNEAPFCDCCIGTHMIRYCTSCKSRLYRLQSSAESTS